MCNGCGEDGESQAQAASPTPIQDAVHAHADQLIDEGRQTFRYDTFGDEAFWGDTIQLHRAIAGSAHGGVGSGVSPRSALSVGLKVDSEALPSDVQAQIKNGTVDLDDPATTLALLKLNSHRRDHRLFRRERDLDVDGHPNAPCVIRRSTTHSHPASVSGWTVGQIVI